MSKWLLGPDFQSASPYVRKTRPRGWSRQWATCRACGQTTHQHMGYGLCAPCFHAAKSQAIEQIAREAEAARAVSV